MKKIISLLLVLALCCAGAGAALAEENAAEEDENTIILCNGGITVTVPESMRNLKGMLQASETGELVPGSGLFGGSIFYLMKTEEVMADLQERYMQIIAEAGDELTEEHVHGAGCFVAVSADEDFEAALPVPGGDRPFERRRPSAGRRQLPGGFQAGRDH